MLCRGVCMVAVLVKLTASGLVFQSAGQVAARGEAAQPAPCRGVQRRRRWGTRARKTRRSAGGVPGTQPAHGRSHAGLVQPDGRRHGLGSVPAATTPGCGLVFLHVARHPRPRRLLQGFGQPGRPGKHRGRASRRVRSQRGQSPWRRRCHLSGRDGASASPWPNNRPLGAVQLLAPTAVTMAHGWVPDRPEPRQG